VAWALLLLEGCACLPVIEMLWESLSVPAGTGKTFVSTLRGRQINLAGIIGKQFLRL
jgi:hypothetical protein